MKEWKAKVIDLSNTSITVFGGSVVVKGIFVNVALSAHVCNINDGSITIFIIPLSTAAGVVIDFAGENGVLFNDNLIVAPEVGATGNITIMYQERA